MNNPNIVVRVATPEDRKYAETITGEMEESAKARGTGIAKRSPAYIRKKMEEGKAVIAHSGQSLTLVAKWYQIRICLRKLLITEETVVRRFCSPGCGTAGWAGLAWTPADSMFVNDFFNFCFASLR